MAYGVEEQRGGVGELFEQGRDDDGAHEVRRTVTEEQSLPTNLHVSAVVVEPCAQSRILT
jgi:hypothetical protein